MESFGSLFDEEWENLSRMFSGDQDSDHFPSHGLFSSEHDDHGLNFETPSIVSSVMAECYNDNSSFIDHRIASENINPNFYHYFSQESNINGCAAYDGAVSLPYPSNSNITPLPTNGVCDDESVSLFDENNNNSSLLAQVFSEDSMEEILCLKEDVIMENSVSPSVSIADQRKHAPVKRKIETSESPKVVVDKVNNEIPNKKTRVSRSDNKNKKKVQPKNKQKVMAPATVNGNGNIDGLEDTNNNKGGGNAPTASSCSCSSEDDLSLSQDPNGSGGVNSNWKTRASRGAATDPQSLYARKRRERINERLKILQNLVPNGTKVDISTMLEEAVHYVKFLQLQIKLLSSDEMWMYAPIAYNGMDMGLYQKLQI
ncbi:transcription factor bHLH84-like [Cynara cardunculus var. scolymus]|uniref:BHLH domain-containing protein n=1 Tax=Cynara cardunculus var. scolymus TaxID=59895 RepID=A0A103XYR9_CYNCS|nr:transcription factor bHLH84-like [Cynara cardunculus var. scolymus]KVH99393.1 hypothetical protein Ccrd_022376 [Cynara cardunculus var. scolymus]